ncbi:MAG: DegV family protein [Tumebacillaceae bacterium]
MSKIAIVTDSTSYLPMDTVHKHNITVVPLTVNFGQESYKEGVDIVAAQFYPRLAAEKNLPTTSQPAVGELAMMFEKLLETHDAVLAILLSSGLSGTANSAETAARMVGGNIRIIDSKITSTGQAEQVLLACELAEQGVELEEIVTRVIALRDSVKAYFVVDSLDHLHRGGRVSGISAAIGSLLQVKPVLTVNAVGGLELFEKVRTRKKALARVIELVKGSLEPGKELHIAVVYAHNLEDAKLFRDQVAAEFPQARIDMSELGPVIGTHVGPGLLALIYDQR